MDIWPVYVPSKGRADTSTTLQMLADEGIVASVFVHESEVAAYCDRWTGTHVVYSHAIEPDPVLGILGAIRQEMLVHARDLGHEWMWQLDDDILKAYADGHRSSLGDMLLAVQEEASRYPTLGLCGPWRRGAFPQRDDIFNCGTTAITAIRTDGIGFWPWMMEDVDAAMTVLAEGRHTARFAVGSFENAAMSKLEGGCYDDYQSEVLPNAVAALASKWSDDLSIGSRVWPNGGRTCRPKSRRFTKPERTDQ